MCTLQFFHIQVNKMCRLYIYYRYILVVCQPFFNYMIWVLYKSESHHFVVVKYCHLALLQYFCCCSITRSYLTLCDLMNYSTAGQQASLSFTIFMTLLRLIPIESVIQSNHLIHCSPPSPPALNLFQHQDLFQWVSSSQQVAKYWSFNISPWLTDLISLQSKVLSRVFTITTVWKHQFFSVQSSL